MPDILPNIDNEPAQGIQALLDTVYLWNQDVANDLIDKINELLEELGDLSNAGEIKPYAELVAPIKQYLPTTYGDGLYVANADISVLPSEFNPAQWTLIATKIDRAGITQEINTAVGNEATARSGADDLLQGQITSHVQNESNPHNVTKAQVGLGNVDNTSDANKPISTATQGALNNLQTQIDAISAASDVKDIVGTYAELEQYDTSTLGNNDIIKVLQDETQEDATTYYRWSTSTSSFSLIGEEGPYYTKSQTDTLLGGKQNTLTAGEGITIENNVISAETTGDFVPQYTTMPVASADNLGDIVQFIGTTDANYTNGYFYKCAGATTPSSAVATQTVGSSLSNITVNVATLEEFFGWTTDNSIEVGYTENGWSIEPQSFGVTYTGTPVIGDRINTVYTAAVTTYTWEQTDVQPAGSSLPDQTGQSGKFLTTDGTDASWGAALENTADMWSSIATGGGTVFSGKSNSIAIGASASVSVHESIAIGPGARVTASNAIMLKAGNNGSWAVNSEAHTFKVNLAQGTATLIGSDNKIPSDILTHAINKYSTMPTAGVDNEGWIVQYTGITDSTYTHGYIYECKAQGTDPETYAWEAVEVQPSSGGGGTTITVITED